MAIHWNSDNEDICLLQREMDHLLHMTGKIEKYNPDAARVLAEHVAKVLCLHAQAAEAAVVARLNHADTMRHKLPTHLMVLNQALVKLALGRLPKEYASLNTPQIGEACSFLMLCAALWGSTEITTVLGLLAGTTGTQEGTTDDTSTTDGGSTTSDDPEDD